MNIVKPYLQYLKSESAAQATSNKFIAQTLTSNSTAVDPTIERKQSAVTEAPKASPSLSSPKDEDADTQSTLSEEKAKETTSIEEKDVEKETGDFLGTIFGKNFEEAYKKGKYKFMYSKSTRARQRRCILLVNNKGQKGMTEEQLTYFKRKLTDAEITLSFNYKGSKKVRDKIFDKKALFQMELLQVDLIQQKAQQWKEKSAKQVVVATEAAAPASALSM